MFETWLRVVFSYPGWMQLLGILGRSAVIYLAVVFGMRLLGARPLGRLSAHDFVLVIIISNSVQNALVGGDNTLAGGLASAATLLFMNLLFTWLTERFPEVEKRLVGEPVILIDGGRAQSTSMRQAGVTQDELLAALREHGVERIEDAKLAMLEIDGSISVLPGDVASPSRRRKVKAPGERA